MHITRLATVTLALGLPLITASTYDYVIAGAGTSGLLLAVALTANPDISVAVLEAGGDDRTDVRVTSPEREGSIAGTAYDWNFTTVPQQGLYEQKTVKLSRGKVLGGSSAMNWMINMRASAAEYDAWESVLGNNGWNWSTLLTASKASEDFTNPPANVSAIPGLSYDDANHGLRGPIASTMAKNLNNLFPSYIIPALRTLGVSIPEDRDSGNTTGASSVPLAINASTYTRSYSASAYTNVQQRPNLHVFTHSQATRIIWESKKVSGLAVAQGLAFINLTSGPNTKESIINASNVVLSAGCIQTPQLLELSGIGDPSVLKPLKITPVVNLPAVGTNFSDHPTFAGFFSFNLSAAELTGGAYAQNFLDYAQPSRFLSPSDHAALATALKPTKPPSSSGISTSTWAAFRHLFTLDEPFIEYGWYNQFSTAYLLHPMSQGTIHINTTNPLSAPKINPAYNTAILNLTIAGTTSSISIDSWLLAKAVQYYAVTLPKTKPLAAIKANYTTISALADFSVFETTVAGKIASGAHLTGGAVMLPRAKGGVVDASLRVYGTSNVRVVDSSVVPFSPGQHPMGLAYAIAMRAAEIFA